MPSSYTIEHGTARDLDAVCALLERCGLPAAGLRDHADTLLVARADADIVGSAALEVYGDKVLLRSVAVAPPWRGRGLGHALTDAALDLARDDGATQAYLLTETADAFFPRFGFRPTTREAVPPAVRTSVEFTSACPASARVFVADLG